MEGGLRSRVQIAVAARNLLGIKEGLVRDLLLRRIRWIAVGGGLVDETPGAQVSGFWDRVVGTSFHLGPRA